MLNIRAFKDEIPVNIHIYCLVKVVKRDVRTWFLLARVGVDYFSLYKTRLISDDRYFRLSRNIDRSRFLFVRIPRYSRTVVSAFLCGCLSFFIILTLSLFRSLYLFFNYSHSPLCRSFSPFQSLSLYFCLSEFFVSLSLFPFCLSLSNYFSLFLTCNFIKLELNTLKCSFIHNKEELIDPRE